MVMNGVEEMLNATADNVAEVPVNFLVNIGRIGLWLSAAGIIIILWIVFQIIALIVNRKKRKALYKIKEDIERVEVKVDRIEKILKEGKKR